jgi:hypothetical protein
VVPATQEAEAYWSPGVQGQPLKHSETPPQKFLKNEKEGKEFN